jgi:hypothetical protein
MSRISLIVSGDDFNHGIFRAGGAKETVIGPEIAEAGGEELEVGGDFGLGLRKSLIIDADLGPVKGRRLGSEADQ